MLTYFGLNPEITTDFMRLFAAQAKAFMVITWCRYKTNVYIRHLSLSAGEQYRLHLKNGGYRC